jgi:hypothetical protein
MIRILSDIWLYRMAYAEISKGCNALEKSVNFLQVAMISQKTWGLV